MKNYIPRLIENAIEERMRLFGAVCVQGTKWCGKSTTSKRFANTVIDLGLQPTLEKYKILVSSNSDSLFKGEKPILLDEWQKIPALWELIKTEVDQTDAIGDFIITGSATPSEDKERHSGLGRITRLTMRPMSLWESGESSGQISLKDLFEGKHEIGGDSKLPFDKIPFVICRGGWPRTVSLGGNESLKFARIFYNDLTEHDISSVDDISRNPERARKIMKSYSRNISTLASNRTIKQNVTANDDTLDDKTLSSYTNALRKVFVIEDVEAWSPSLRSKSAIRSSAKRQLVDPSLAAAALSATPDDLMDDFRTLGFLFESLCTRDLRIYAEKMDGKIFHYNDENGLEVDAIIKLDNDDWGAVEIKLGGDQIDEAAANLLKFKNMVNTEKMKEPKFLMILTGIDYGYRRPDGVLVVPIGCLKD